MERTDEMAENVQRSSELAHLKDKGPSLDSDHNNFMESTSLFISRGSLKGKDPVRNTSSDSRLDSLGTRGPLRTNISDGNILVEELTQDHSYNLNHASTSLSLPGPSKTHEIPVASTSSQNYYNLLGGTTDIISKESGTVSNKVDVKNFSFNHIGARRLNPSDCNQTSAIGNSSGNDSTAISSSLRTKILPASGFSQYLVRDALKGKSVAYWHSGSYDATKVASKSQNVEKNQNVSTRVLPTIFHDNTVNTRFVDSQGFSLRHWLKPCVGNFKKAVRLQIFKKIVELVDSSHSNGVGLQQLRPSYLLLLPSKEVKYSGMFVSNAKKEEIDSVSNQASDHHYLPMKRHMDQNNRKNDRLPTKCIKLNNDVEVGTAPLKLFEGHGTMKGDVCKGSSTQNFMGRNYTGFDYSELPIVTSNPITDPMQWEERWYVSPEELNSSVSSLITSNIYSLGVLFFEVCISFLIQTFTVVLMLTQDVIFSQLLCHFKSLEEHAAAMLELRQRILPSTFLSESPKEAAFCLWLLHPNPSSRPKSRYQIF